MASNRSQQRNKAFIRSLFNSKNVQYLQRKLAYRLTKANKMNNLAAKNYHSSLLLLEQPRRKNIYQIIVKWTYSSESLNGANMTQQSKLHCTTISSELRYVLVNNNYRSSKENNCLD